MFPFVLLNNDYCLWFFLSVNTNSINTITSLVGLLTFLLAVLIVSVSRFTFIIITLLVIIVAVVVSLITFYLCGFMLQYCPGGWASHMLIYNMTVWNAARSVDLTWESGKTISFQFLLKWCRTPQLQWKERFVVTIIIAVISRTSNNLSLHLLYALFYDCSFVLLGLKNNYNISNK